MLPHAAVAAVPGAGQQRAQVFLLSNSGDSSSIPAAAAELCLLLASLHLLHTLLHLQPAMQDTPVVRKAGTHRGSVAGRQQHSCSSATVPLTAQQAHSQC